MEKRINIESPLMSKVKEYLASILSKLALDTDLKEAHYQIELSDDINAGAFVHNKTIIVTAGLIKFCTRGELMYVIGHEAGHILKHEHGLRVEENRCDLLSAQRLFKAGISPEVIIHFFRKMAVTENYHPWRQDYVSMIYDDHSPP